MCGWMQFSTKNTVNIHHSKPLPLCLFCSFLFVVSCMWIRNTSILQLPRLIANFLHCPCSFARPWILNFYFSLQVCVPGGVACQGITLVGNRKFSFQDMVIVQQHINHFSFMVNNLHRKPLLAMVESIFINTTVVLRVIINTSGSCI
jgi:hypothetical protein